jgi:hypothetical protein
MSQFCFINNEQIHVNDYIKNNNNRNIVCQKGHELILVNGGDHPKLLKSFMRKEIEIETLCVLDSILNFVTMWKQKIKDDIVWPNHRLKIVKYRDFLPKDKTKFKVILRKIINA